ncbi:Tol-Pal system beta propeller repeat protein TolB [Oecophyllibacter saccharovorans]|uniref:Tol-Pal system beta propeller repeat protein TolB n=1 Tax=Oecophyllibacter saccharovorans TaxID=2558360 RepID=UPI001174A70F|nr:Tol-Pal system beta propeller repeat protein TolB [Oecophyllibacter saccharovorans]TPW36549.1 Tol-Pal system protein TolB [Oecophyllibacter saccharovorans]
MSRSSSRSTPPLITDPLADHLAPLPLTRRSVLGRGLAGAALLGTSLAALPTDARAQSGGEPGAGEITVDQAHQAPIPILIPDFGPGLGDRISQVISNDLSSTGLFRVIPGGSLPANARPDFAALKARGVRAAVAGSATGDGSVRVEMRLWDVLSGQQLQGTAYTASEANWRQIAHLIADVIYERLLGEPGYFNTRIAYIARTGPHRHQETRLAIMDQDGANPHMLTDGRWLTLEPRFDPSGSQLAFLSYANNRPRVYLYNLRSGQQSLLGSFEGISYAPRFAPNGQSIILAVTTPNGGSDIYTIDLASHSRRRLTSAPGVIDTSPCYSPDGRQIVFNSDRGGSPQLYIMNADGSGAHRISYGQGHYGSPVWSPRGDLIAFTRINHGAFSLGVMNPDGTGERILTQGFTVESPSFAPNGRAIVFCRQSASGSGGAGFSSRLGVIDVAGFNEHELPTSTGASDPAWSPFRNK